MKDEVFGFAVDAMDHLPANTFMLVSRVSIMPAVFHVIRCEDGEIKEWRGTLSEAWEALGWSGPRW